MSTMLDFVRRGKQALDLPPESLSGQNTRKYVGSEMPDRIVAREKEKDGDLDSIQQKMTKVQELLLYLLLDVGPRIRSQEPKSKENLPILISEPELREWTENRLADFSLCTSGIGVLVDHETHPSTHLVKPAIASLLTLLGSLLDFCLVLVTSNVQIHDDSSDSDSGSDRGSNADADAGDLSPWSDEDDELGEDDDAPFNYSRAQQTDRLVLADAKKPTTVPSTNKTSSSTLSESMRGIESVLGQLIRLSFETRQPVLTEKSRRANATLETKEQTSLRRELTTTLRVLSRSTGKHPVSKYGTIPSRNNLDGLSKVQSRLVDAVLRRRATIEYSWNYTNNSGSQLLPINQATNASRSRNTNLAHEGLSTRTAPEPSIAQISIASEHIRYPEPCKVAYNGSLSSQCPFCAQVFAESLGEDSRRWRKHIDQDLLPYMCPAEECSVSHICYSSLDDWKLHLFKDHTRATFWHCPACKETINTSQDFIFHIERNHTRIIDSGLLEDFAESCKQSELVPLKCPVCGDNSDCTLDLIGKHIHDFSLLHLPSPSIDSSSDEQAAEDVDVYRRDKKSLPAIILPTNVHSIHDLEPAAMSPYSLASPLSSNASRADAGKKSHDLIYGTKTTSSLDPLKADVWPKAPSESTPHLLSSVATDPQSTKPPARILCLDGGGVRGLSSLIILRKIMAQIKRDEGKPYPDLKPCDYFDYICGTGTGGLTAILLGRLRLTVDEAIDKYIGLSQDIFKQQSTLSGTRLPHGAPLIIRHGLPPGVISLIDSDAYPRGGRNIFDARILEQKIKEMVSCYNGETEDSCMYESLQPEGRENRTCHVAVVAVSADQNDIGAPKLLKTYDQNDRCKIWEAVRATSAAPSLFDAVEIGSPPTRYFDAGLRFTNPAWVAYKEVQRLWPRRRIGVFLSLGAGRESPISMGKLEIAQAVTGMSMSAARVHNEIYTHFGACYDKNVFFRFNMDQGLEDVGLQEWQQSSKLASYTEAYMEQPKISHAYKTCAASISRLSAGIEIVSLPMSIFNAVDEEKLDNDFAGCGMRYWYRENIGLSGYPSTVDVGTSFKGGDIWPVGTEILSLRRVASILIRGEVHGIIPGKYRVKWLLWFWAGKNATPKSNPYFRPYGKMGNTVTERRFPSIYLPVFEPKIDSGFYAPTKLKLSVGRAKDAASFRDIGLDRHQHPDPAKLLLCEGYSEQCIDIHLWRTMRNTGWVEARDTIIEVDDDGHLAFVMSRDMGMGWLGGVSFGGVRLEPIVGQPLDL